MRLLLLFALCFCPACHSSSVDEDFCKWYGARCGDGYDPTVEINQHVKSGGGD